MTPLLPRAPIREPWAAARITEAAEERVGAAWASSTAERMVRYMLEPVSPSGTGKTLSSLTCSWLACSHARELRSPARKAPPLISRSGARALAASALSAPVIALFQVDPLDVDVDGDDVQAEGLLDLVLDRAHQVVGDLADAGPVLGDDVEVDDEAALPHFDLDAAVDGLAIEPLGDPVAEATSRHADDAVALPGRVTDDRGHHAPRDLDAAQPRGVAQGPSRPLPARHVSPTRCGTVSVVFSPRFDAWPAMPGRGLLS